MSRGDDIAGPRGGQPCLAGAGRDVRTHLAERGPDGAA